MRVARLLPVLSLIGALATGVTANADIYRWTDASGKLHFTERLDHVPPEHRVAAIKSAAMPATRPVQIFSSESATTAPRARRRRRTARNGEVNIPFVREGSLMRVDVRLNDVVTAPFLIDTGASGVTLPRWVAERLGLHIGPDAPHVRVLTANGVVSCALVQLDSVEIGGARVEGLEAHVNPTMEIGLLGGAFLNNFVYRVDAAASAIMLTPNEQIRGGLGQVEWRERFHGISDPLAKLVAHLETGVVRRKGEIARLLGRQKELEEELERLETQADRLGVPQKWRE